MKAIGENKGRFLVKIILVAGSLVLIFVGIGILKEVLAKKQIQEEIRKLQVEAEKIGHENALTQERIAYLSSEDYQKREAKDKLNLQSPDENVVIIKSSVSSAETKMPEVTRTVPPKIEIRANYAKWWEHFFQY